MAQQRCKLIQLLHALTGQRPLGIRRTQPDPTDVDGTSTETWLGQLHKRARSWNFPAMPVHALCQSQPTHKQTRQASRGTPHEGAMATGYDRGAHSQVVQNSLQARLDSKEIPKCPASIGRAGQCLLSHFCWTGGFANVAPPTCRPGVTARNAAKLHARTSLFAT